MARISPIGPPKLVASGVVASALLGLCLGLGTAERSSADPAEQSGPRWGGPQPVADSPAGATQRDASQINTPDGTLHALWVDSRLEPGDAVYYARLAPEARLWELWLRVWHAPPEVSVGKTAIAVDSLGNVHALWEQGRNGDADIAHAMLPYGSRAWGESRRLNDDLGGAAQASPAIAADPYGTVHMVWEDYRRGGADLFYAARVSSGEWLPNQAFDHAPTGDQRRPSLATAKNGWIHAAWQDSRDGRGDIYASVLPPGSRVWWPNTVLNRRSAGAVQSEPRVAAAGDGRVHVLWIDRRSTGRLMLASLAAGEQLWASERLLFQPTRGRLLSASLAAGPGEHVFTAWSESRDDTDGSRIYAATIPMADTVQPARVDGSRTVSHGVDPLAAIDAQADLHVTWLAERGLDPAELVHASLAAEPPPYPAHAAQGRLSYVPFRFNCAMGGFLLSDCEGSEQSFVVTRGLDLLPFLGSYVEVSGQRVEDNPCGHLLASSVKFVGSPCPSDDAVVTGEVSVGGRPARLARVSFGDEAAFTGEDGRYYLDGLARGDTPVTSTLTCGLVSSLGVISLRRGLNRLPPAVLQLGDVVQDCVVDMRDVVRVAGQIKAEPPFDPPCSDLDGDGHVGLSDLAIVAAAFGRVCPRPWQGDDSSARLDGAELGEKAVNEDPKEPRLRIKVRSEAPISVLQLALLRAQGAGGLDEAEAASAQRQPFDVMVAGPHFVLRNQQEGARSSLVVALLGSPQEPRDEEMLVAEIPAAALARAELEWGAISAWDGEGRSIGAELILESVAQDATVAGIRLILPHLMRRPGMRR